MVPTFGVLFFLWWRRNSDDWFWGLRSVFRFRILCEKNTYSFYDKFKSMSAQSQYKREICIWHRQMQAFDQKFHDINLKYLITLFSLLSLYLRYHLLLNKMS